MSASADGRVSRVLLYRLGSLGDSLLALPACHLVRTVYPDAKVTLLTNQPVNAKAAPAASILQGAGLCDDVIEYPIRLRHVGKVLGLWRTLRAGRFDCVIHLTSSRGLFNSARDYAFFRLCGIARVIGVPFARRDLKCIRSEPDGYYEWEAARLTRRVGKFGAIDFAEERWWDLRLNAAEVAEGEQVLASHGLRKKLIAASVGTKFDTNDWTDPNWRQLLVRLNEYADRCDLVFIGAETERQRTAELMQHWQGAAANLCGTTDVRLSAAILRRAAVFVGHDSGPTHLAATVGTPCVAIFSARGLTGQWFPRGVNHKILFRSPSCQGCGLSVCVKYQKRCILEIPPAEVAAAVATYL